MLKAPYILVTAGILALMAGPVLAQQTPDAPIPAYHSPLASQADNAQSQPADQLSPDTRPLAGAQNVGLGVAPLTHTYWQPHVSLSGSLDSNALDAQGNSGWTNWTSVSGGVDVHRNAGNSTLTLSYTGGGSFSNDGNASGGIVQALSFDDQLAYRRTTLSILESVSYLPETGFGFGGIGTELGAGSAGLSAPFNPSQSILTARGQNLANSSVLQVNRLLTARSSLTFAGGYSALHYFDNNLLNSNGANVQAGYNYQLTRKDTVAVSYSFNAIRYGNSNQSINSNGVQGSYARRVTGRLAFQVGGGPSVTSFEGKTGIGSATSSISRLYWSLNSSLQYQLKVASLSVAYSHGVSSGSGVLPGATTDSVSATAGRTLSYTTSAGASFGFARNSALAASGVPTPSFNYWYGGANVSRTLGRTLNASLAYQAQIQNTSTTFCIGSNCGTQTVRHTISISLGWQARPMRF